MCITEKNFPMFSVKKSDIFILLHLSTTSGPQESNSMFFQRKGIPDLWIAVQNIWNFRKISQMLCTVIHRHNDERKTAVRWQKLHKSGTMDSLRKGVPAMAIKYTEEQLNSVDKSMLIQMFLNQQEQLEKVSANLHSLDTKMQAMMEQLIIGNKNRFGRSSEKMEDTQQMRFIEVDGTLVFFNEAEAVCDLDVLWSSFFVTLVAKKIVLINLCCRPCFIWGSITIITVWTNMIIINVCKFFYLLIECFLCCKLIQICAFILQGIEVTLHRCIVVRISCFAHALCHIYRFAEFGKCFGRIL